MINKSAEAAMKLKYDNIFDAVTDNTAEAAMLKMRADLASNLRDIVANSPWAGGKKIDVDVKKDRIVITHFGLMPKYTPEELLIQFDPDTPPVKCS
jgi:hypothetical protein